MIKQLLIPILALVLAFFSILSLNSIMPELVSKQVLFFTLGFLVFFYVSNLDIKFIKKLAPLVYFVIVAALLYLVIWQKKIRGISAWIPLFAGLRFQPSQFAVGTTALFLATVIDYLNLKKLRDFFVLLVIVLLPGVLILVEPDLGTAFIYFFSMMVLFPYLKIPVKFYLLSFFGLVIILPLLFLNLEVYQLQRLTDFMQTFKYGYGGSYNAQQALIAVGSGGIMGRGLGYGLQSHLRFLPERQTDFIFASIAEEWGFLGTSIILIIYFVLGFFMLNASKDVNLKKKNFLIVLAYTIMILIQAIVNIGMNIGVLPITGITLPLLSYGGSSILSIFVMLGIIQNVINSQESDEKIYIR